MMRGLYDDITAVARYPYGGGVGVDYGRLTMLIGGLLIFSAFWRARR